MGILGVRVGVGIGILGKLGVGVEVGPYTFRLRNPGVRFGKGQGKTDLTAGFRRVGRDLERRSPNGFQQR